MLLATEFVSLTIHLFYDQRIQFAIGCIFSWNQNWRPIIHDQDKKLLRHVYLKLVLELTFPSLIKC